MENNSAIEEVNFLKMKLGKSRRGKTTKSIEEAPKPGRVIVVAVRFSNAYMGETYGEHWIPATKEYLDEYLGSKMEEKFKENPNGFLILCKSGESDYVFEKLQNVKNVYILVDDASLVIYSEEPWLNLLATIGQNKNCVDITTHSPRGDVPKKTYDLATEVVIIGGWTGKDNCKWLYDNVYEGSLEFEEFYAILKENNNPKNPNGWGSVFVLKGETYIGGK